MPDIKTEKPLSINKEKPAAALESLKQRLGDSFEKEKVKTFEQVQKKVMEEIAQTENKIPSGIGPIAGVASAQAKQQKQIENVLAEGLDDIYMNLTPAKRLEFKRAGEETAKKINELLAKAKINIGEIIKLIKKWLSLIPGVNKYFLEQEAKIKADEIVKMKDDNDK